METELTAIFPHGGRVKLFGGANAYERIRGLYLDGAVLDEFALLHPDCFDVVVRPALADYRGFALISGTPAGRDHFYKIYNDALRTPETWDRFVIPVTETTALHPDEVDDMRQKMPANKFARELLCDFEAPVEGSYYGDLINDLEMKGRICKVPYDTQAAVYTSWDIGMHDLTSIWFAQRIGREMHIIDFMQDNNKGFDWWVKQLDMKGYNYAGHILPHDIKVREFSTGRSRFAALEQLELKNLTVCPNHKVADGIEAVRSMLSICWIDGEKCQEGLTAVKAYQSAPAINLGTMHDRALKNWAGHASDSLRYLAVGIDMAAGWADSSSTWDSSFRDFRIPGLV